MNDRDRNIGRLLLEKGLIGQPVLVQAGQTTMQRRQAGQHVEVLAVLVEMGAITREVASSVWQQAAAENGGGAGAPAPAPTPVAAAPAPIGFDSGESFDPTADLGSMGAPPPADVLGFQPPPTRPAPQPQDFATDAPTLVGNIGGGGGIGSGMGSGNFGAPPPGTGAFGSGAFGAGGAAAFGTNNFGSGNFGAGSANFGAGSANFPGATLPPSNFAEPGSALGAGPGSNFGSGFGSAGGGSAFGAAGGAFGGDTGFGSGGGFGAGVAPPPTGTGFGAPPPGGGGFGAPPPGTGFGAPPPGGGFGAPPPGGGGFGAGGGAGFGAPAAGGGFGSPPADTDEFDAPPARKASSSRSAKRGKSSRRNADGGRRSVSERSALKPRKQKNLPLIVGLSAVVVVLVVAIVFVVSSDPKTPASKTDEGTTPSKTGELPSVPVTPSRVPKPTNTGGTKPKDDPLTVRPSPLFDEPKTPLNPADKDARSMEAQENYSLRAAEFSDIERYDRAESYLVKVLELWPKWFQDSKGYRKLSKEKQGYRKMDKFKKRLEAVLKEGAGSPNFKKWIQRLESRELKDRQPDLAELPCVERYRKKAEDILGTEAYHESAQVFEDVEELFDLKSEGLTD